MFKLTVITLLGVAICGHAIAISPIDAVLLSQPQQAAKHDDSQRVRDMRRIEREAQQQRDIAYRKVMSLSNPARNDGKGHRYAPQPCYSSACVR